MVNSTVVERPQLITSTNHGGIITITAAMLMVFMILFYLIRMVVRIGFNNRFDSDDVAATIGSVFGVAQSITTIIAVKAGLGEDLDLLTEDGLNKVAVITYTADILFILTLALAKISAAELVARLSRQREHLIACRAMSALIAVWGIASIFIIAIGCHPATPWDMVDRCSNLVVSWTAIHLIDIALEIALLILPLCLVWPLQMPKTNKFIVTIAFSARIVIIPLALVRIYDLNRISKSTNWPFDVVMAIVFAQLEMHFSLIAATVPCLRPFLKAANTGYLATQAVQVDRAIHNEENNDSSYAMASKVSRLSLRSIRKNSLAILSPRTSLATLSRLQGHDEVAVQLPAHLEAAEEHPVLDPFSHPTLTTVRHHDQRSLASDASDRKFIKKTVEYDIQYTTMNPP